VEPRLAEIRAAGPRTAGPRLVVNGRTRELGEVGGHVTLLEWLRGSGLTGLAGMARMRPLLMPVAPPLATDRRGKPEPGASTIKSL